MENTIYPEKERSAGGPGEGEPSLNGSPGRPFLLYRQRHVLLSAGRKENVGLELWVLKVVMLLPAEYDTIPQSAFRLTAPFPQGSLWIMPLRTVITARPDFPFRSPAPAPGPPARYRRPSARPAAVWCAPDTKSPSGCRDCAPAPHKPAGTARPADS